MTISHAFAAAAWMQFWQLTAVILFVGVATLLVGRRRPHLAYALWMVVLVKALTPPVWSSNLSALARLQQPAPPAWLIDDAAASPAKDSPSEPQPQAERTPSAPSTAPPASRRPANAPARTIWPLAWLGGVLAMIICAAFIRLCRNRLLAAAAPAATPLVALVEDLARHIGVRPPAVLISPDGLGPAVCGMRRPLLVLPRSVVDASLDLPPLVAHELVHLRRGDQLAVGIQFLVQAVWWFHPLAWWANRRICRVRESCCDAETVAALQSPPRRYARALVEVLDAKLRVRPLVGFPGVRPVQVTAARVKEILAMSDSLLSRTPASYVIAALVLAALVLPAANDSTVTAVAQTAPAPPAKPVLVLKYGDNKADGKKSIAGAGEMIRFTMPEGQANPLKALRIHCARYGYPQPPDEDVEINILNEDMTDVVHTELVPYRLFKRQAESRWQMIPFEDSVEVPGVFWIVLNFNAEATKGVYVSYDTSTGGEHSRIGLNDQDAKETDFKGDWMVQAVLEK